MLQIDVVERKYTIETFSIFLYHCVVECNLALVIQVMFQ